MVASENDPTDNSFNKNKQVKCFHNMNRLVQFVYRHYMFTKAWLKFIYENKSQKVNFHVDNIKYLQLPDLTYNFVSKKHVKILNFILNKWVFNKLFIHSEKMLLGSFSKPTVLYR